MSSTSVTKSIVELIAESPDVDNQAPFEALWKIFAELRAKIDARFELKLDPSCEPFQSYSNDEGQGQGTINALTGPEMDWMIHSWMGTPQSTFTNMHLTAWLGPQIKVPHLWMAMGTIPDVFVYFDYGPRADLYVETDYLDHYFEPTNQLYMDVQNDPGMPGFVSQDLLTRQFISPTGICLAGMKPTPDVLARLGAMAHAHIDRWLTWVNEAEPVPAAERSELAKRDLYMRRTIAERDPANAIATQLYGEPMKDELVRALWGGDRKIPRPLQN